MKIREYLLTLDPKQQVMVILQDKKGTHLLADHEAGYLAQSSKSDWLKLEVVNATQRRYDILITVKKEEPKTKVRYRNLLFFINEVTQIDYCCNTKTKYMITVFQQTEHADDLIDTYEGNTIDQALTRALQDLLINYYITDSDYFKIENLIIPQN